MRTTTAKPRHEQLSFEWTALPAATPEANVPPPQPVASDDAPPTSTPHPLPTTSVPADPWHAVPPPPVQVLPWDFRTSFPEPLDAAIEAGVIHDEDREPENVRALHDEHARHALALLANFDAICDARWRGVDPQTGKTPTTEKQRERLDAHYRNEPGRLEHAFEVLMDVYDEAFGDEAAQAFRKAIRAWHAGIEVIAERPPVAPPLDIAVDGHVFGTEEVNGRPVHPEREELQAIVEQVIDRLEECPPGPQRDAELRRYADDFGDDAADQLATWTAAVARLEVGNDQYGPGHPWHYYQEGDAATPIPPESISPAEPSEHWGLDGLPKNASKRRELLERMLMDQTRQLEQDIVRYIQLTEHGTTALSEYDRDIAYGGNAAMAWASTVAVKYNHIRNGKGRIEAIRVRLKEESSRRQQPRR